MNPAERPSNLVDSCGVWLWAWLLLILILRSCLPGKIPSLPLMWGRLSEAPLAVGGEGTGMGAACPSLDPKVGRGLCSLPPPFKIPSEDPLKSAKSVSSQAQQGTSSFRSFGQ